MGLVKTAKLFEELTDAGIPVVGVSSDGRIDFADSATPAQRDLAQQILSTHDATAKTRQEQVSLAALAALRALNAREVSKLATADWQRLFVFFLAERGWLDSEGKLQVPENALQQAPNS